MKNLTVSGQVIDVRSDHLIAMLTYCYEQATTSEIDVLAFGANENALDYDEQVSYIAWILQQLEELVATGNKDLLIVSTDDKQLFNYHHS